MSNRDSIGMPRVASRAACAAGCPVEAAHSSALAGARGHGGDEHDAPGRPSRRDHRRNHARQRLSHDDHGLVAEDGRRLQRHLGVLIEAGGRVGAG